MDRETLKQKIAEAVSFPPYSSSEAFREVALEIGRSKAEAVLSAISEAGCVIVPGNPTIEYYWKAAEAHFDKTGDELIALHKPTVDFWNAMLSASPFRQEE